MKKAALLIALLLLPGAARAGLTEQQLSEVALISRANARLPLDLSFRNTDGQQVSLGAAIADRPTVLLPVDFTCTQLCSPALAIVGGALKETGLIAGRDYSFIILGIDARDSRDDARRFTAAQAGGPGLSVLQDDAASVKAFIDAIGYRFQIDAANDAVAHPAALLALTADGRVSRTLSSLALNSTDLRLALLEAGGGRIGGLTGRLALLCYGFDAVHGLYTSRVMALLQISCTGFVAMAAAALGFLAWFGARRRAVP